MTYLQIIDYFIQILYSLICVIGTIGNSIVIYVILYTSSLDAAKLHRKRNSIQNTLTTNRRKSYANRRSTRRHKSNASTQQNYEYVGCSTIPMTLAGQTSGEELVQLKREINKEKLNNKKIFDINENIIVSSTNKLEAQLEEQIDINDDNNSALNTALAPFPLTSSTNVNIQISKTNINSNKPTKKFSYLYSIYYRFRKKFVKLKLTVTNFYLINLALVDFLFLFFMPILITTTILKRWIFGLILCKVYFSIVFICQFNAAFIICILSFDRWLAVKFPLKINNYRNMFVAKIIIFFSWLLAISLTLPVIIHTKLTNTSNLANDTNTNTTISAAKYRCTIDWPDNWTLNIFNKTITAFRLFHSYTLTFNYLIPVSFIIIFYIQVLNKINQKGCNLIKTKNRMKSYRKITRMVLAVIGCYVACWTPYWSLQIIFTVIDDEILENYGTTFMIISNSTQVIAYLNSALNPLLYSYLSENFRNNFKLTFFNTIGCERKN